MHLFAATADPAVPRPYREKKGDFWGGLLGGDESAYIDWCAIAEYFAHTYI
jgi:hypothetical protein